MSTLPWYKRAAILLPELLGFGLVFYYMLFTGVLDLPISSLPPLYLAAVLLILLPFLFGFFFLPQRPINMRSLYGPMSPRAGLILIFVTSGGTLFMAIATLLTPPYRGGTSVIFGMSGTLGLSLATYLAHRTRKQQS